MGILHTRKFFDKQCCRLFVDYDYYPFGMGMPGRKFDAGSAYRYGFNGKENDNEVKGEGNQQDYGMRIYDPRTGKFLSVDPLCGTYPYYTPYQFSSNSPIELVDIDGAEGAKLAYDFVFWLFKSDLSDIHSGLDKIKEGDRQNIITPTDTHIFTDDDPDYTPQQVITIRQTEGKLKAIDGTAKVAFSVQNISNKAQTIVEIPLIVGNLAQTIIKKPTASLAFKYTQKPVSETQKREIENIKKFLENTGQPKKTPVHHIATNKNNASTARGGPWTPRFKKIFENAGLDINKGSENLVKVLNHKGPHPEEYHQLVYDRLNSATQGLKPNTDTYKTAVTKTLETIANEAKQVGTAVNKLLTKQN